MGRLRRFARRSLVRVLLLAGLVVFGAGAAFSGVTLGTMVTELRDWLIHGGGDGVATWDAFWKGAAGDVVFSVSGLPESPASADYAGVAWSKDVTIALTTASGGIHYWFNGAATVTLSEDLSADVNLTPSGDVVFSDGVVRVLLESSAGALATGKAVQILVADTPTKFFGASADIPTTTETMTFR